jgi:hypothetical protein
MFVQILIQQHYHESPWCSISLVGLTLKFAIAVVSRDADRAAASRWMRQGGGWSLDQHTLAPGVGRPRTLDSGALGGPFDPVRWHSMSLSLGQHARLVAAVDGSALAEIPLGVARLNSTRGMAGLGCSRGATSAFANLAADERRRGE